MRSHFYVVAAALILPAAVLLAQSATQPTSQPVSARQMLDDMLKPSGDTMRPLQPMTDLQPTPTNSTSVAPGAIAVPALREGSYLVNRVGRLTKAGESWSFTLESDGRAMQDPPLGVLPNLKLMLMEDQLKESNRDLRFRVTGMVTEYRGKNFLMIDKVVVLSN